MMKRVCWILLFLATPLLGGEEHHRKLVVSGNAILKKPADQLNLEIGVVTQDANAQKALASNSEKIQAVINALEKIGIAPSDYETGNFFVRPTYSTPPKVVPPDWIAKINGYEVTNSINLHTEQITLAGKIIDAVNGAGANSIGNIRFDLKDNKKYRAEAIQEAALQASNDAQTLAEASNVKLGKVLQISLDQPRVNPFRADFGVMPMAKSISTPIESGDVDVRAEVTVIYELE